MNLEELVKLLRYSWLVAPIDAHRVAAAYCAASNDSGEESTADGFGHYLVTTGKLTKWQCDKLLARKWKGFYLDNYVLLQQIGRDVETSSYKALDIRDGKLVCLVVNSVSKTGGQNVYEVEPYTE